MILKLRLEFEKGDTVFLKNFGPGSKWLPGIILDTSGPVSFNIQLEDGRQRRCHQDHLRMRGTSEETSSEENLPEDSIPVFSSTEGAVGTNVTLSPTAEISPATVSAESSSTRLAEHSDLLSATSDGVH